MDTLILWFTAAKSFALAMVDREATFLADHVPNVYLEWSFIVLAYLGLIMVVLLLRPLWILRMGEALQSAPDVPVPWPFNILAFISQHILLARYFRYSDVVLDGWVKAHIKTLRKSFEKIPTVSDRAIYVELPVNITLPGGHLSKQLDKLSRGDLSAIVDGPSFRILVTGEGGAGKTTLALRIARWAMAAKEDERLSPNLMVPVLIEYPLTASTSGANALVEEVRGRLRELTGKKRPISAALCERLLEEKRILVIVDRFSEMDECTRNAIRPTDPNLCANALIVTSRLDEDLGGIPKTVVEPSRIPDGRIYWFIQEYLKQKGVKYNVRESGFPDACLRLSLVVCERDVTPLFAKLYAEQLASRQRGETQAPMPENIPDLILDYLSDLNRYRKDADPDNSTVHGLAQAVAWECLRRTFRPDVADIGDVLTAIAGAGTKKELEYLEKSLRLIHTIGPSELMIRFRLDPLAEYLAAIHLVRLNGRDRATWESFFTEVHEKAGAPDAIKGFLLAIRDCCLSPAAVNAGVPQNVAERLAGIVGLSPEIVESAKVRQSVWFHIIDLVSSDPAKRRSAADALGEIGPNAKAAVPALIEALKNGEWPVHWRAAWALGKIGPDAKAAVPALVEALKDGQCLVRGSAAWALGEIGPDAKAAVPSLMEGLRDNDVRVRESTAGALRKIGPAAVPALMKALKEGEWPVRQSAALSLGIIGPDAKAAVVALTEALKDDDLDVRGIAAKALGKIGPEAKAAVPALIEALKYDGTRGRRGAVEALGKINPEAVPALAESLKDSEQAFRSCSAEALGKVGPEAKAAVPALIEALKDGEWPVRASVAWSLGMIGPDANAAVPALIEALKDGEWPVRANAAGALRWIGPRAKAAVATLVEALKDDDSDVREGAAEALGKIGPVAKAALDALEQLKEDEDEDVRKAAKEAIGKIMGTE